MFLDSANKVYDLEVSYSIPRVGNRTDMVRITEGITTVHDIPKMLALRNKVGKNAIRISLIREKKGS